MEYETSLDGLFGVVLLSILFFKKQKIPRLGSQTKWYSDLTGKANNSDFVVVSGYITNSISQTFDLPAGLSSAPYLIAAQIQLETGVWTDVRTISTFTMFNNNQLQIRIEKSSASGYVGYLIRFLFKK